jgi:hypothetical protein
MAELIAPDELREVVRANQAKGSAIVRVRAAG